MENNGDIQREYIQAATTLNNLGAVLATKDDFENSANTLKTALAIMQVFSGSTKYLEQYYTAMKKKHQRALQELNQLLEITNLSESIEISFSSPMIYCVKTVTDCIVRECAPVYVKLNDAYCNNKADGRLLSAIIMFNTSAAIDMGSSQNGKLKAQSEVSRKLLRQSSIMLNSLWSEVNKKSQADKISPRSVAKYSIASKDLGQKVSPILYSSARNVTPSESTISRAVASRQIARAA